MYLGNATLAGILSEAIEQRDNFKYSEQRFAIYGMYRYTFHPWEVQIGVRNEYTEWKTRQKVKDQLSNNQNGNTLFPSFFVKRDIERETLCR